jgi:hypothetical protein
MGARLSETQPELLTVQQMCVLHPALFTCSGAAVRPPAPPPLECTPLPVIDAAALKAGACLHEVWGR